jgi:hypothetical protein
VTSPNVYYTNVTYAPCGQAMSPDVEFAMVLCADRSTPWPRQTSVLASLAIPSPPRRLLITFGTKHEKKGPSPETRLVSIFGRGSPQRLPLDANKIGRSHRRGAIGLVNSFCITKPRRAGDARR